MFAWLHSVERTPAIRARGRQDTVGEAGVVVQAGICMRRCVCACDVPYISALCAWGMVAAVTISGVGICSGRAGIWDVVQVHKSHDVTARRGGGVGKECLLASGSTVSGSGSANACVLLRYVCWVLGPYNPWA